MKTQFINKESFLLKENIESKVFKYIKESSFYMFYHKDGFLYIFDASSFKSSFFISTLFKMDR